MKRTFIFNDEKDRWIEESEILLFHDILAIFDEESSSIYLWKGPKLKEKKAKQGKKRLKELLSEISEKEWNVYEDEDSFPSEIQDILNSMLEPTKERRKVDRLNFSHFFTIRSCFLVLLGIVIFHTLSVISAVIPLFNPTGGSSLLITAAFYEFWLLGYQSFVVVSLILCIINLLIAIYERDIELIIFSLIGIMVSIGILLYLQRGIFLFLHQPGSTSSLYLISLYDMIVFSILNLLSLLLALLPHIYKLFSFINTYWKFIYISHKDGIVNESR